MTMTPARPDLAAYTESIRLPAPDLVAALRDILGAKLVAYIGGVKETRAVRHWADGSRAISNDADLQRLRISYQAAKLLTTRDTPAVAQAWFQGLNPRLADRSPARLLRESDPDETGPELLAAARQFAAVG
ncbi:hypothetical protein HQO44_20875 [Rhodococcus fascians]|uniref:hypothetical protein n=1 Tax=Rhodococcoides fascians TaxID=1828 RepID=UPI00050C4DFA|nr:hypothetical protein [Rhodococcus fascians]AMY54937.1 hypothetical protein A3L23_03617 [Rhodococcus fascians D188]MBY4208908.1 hypothetical protein [Rhodococcus fascians]